MTPATETPATKRKPGSGGKRPGAGRKPLAEKHAGAIARAEAQIAARLTANKDRLPGIIDRLFELADGVAVEDVNPFTGEKTVYQKPPNLRALTYLADRIMGKPMARQELSSPDGGPLRIEAVFAQALERAYGDSGTGDSDNGEADSG